MVFGKKNPRSQIFKFLSFLNDSQVESLACVYVFEHLDKKSVKFINDESPSTDIVGF